MKYLIPVVLAAFVLVGCSKEKAAIDDSNKATQTAIDNQKTAVDAAANGAIRWIVFCGHSCAWAANARKSGVRYNLRSRT